jgi:site-specific DNA-methyltransferase (adenine-specific)
MFDKVVIGDSTLYCGDCLEVLPTLEKVDAVITDPPYKHGSMNGSGFAGECEFYADGKIDFISDFDLNLYKTLLSGVSDQIVAFCSRDLVPEWLDFAKSEFGGFDVHFWHKTNAIPFTHNVWKSDIEYLILGWRKKTHQPVHQSMKSKAYISPICTDDYHPTAKPVNLMAKYVQVLLPPNGVCLDPFMGSGTTGVAAAQLGRRFIGVERERKYFDIACQRIELASKQVQMFPPKTMKQVDLL